MSHYYTDNSNLKSKPTVFEYVFDNEVFHFTTDIGVFSKEHVDYGSYLLLKTVYKRDLGKKFLDLGCGFGPIGIITKRFHPETEVSMVDINSRACDLSRLNALNNRVSVSVYQTDDIRSLDQKFNTILLNPPIRAGKVVMFDLYEKAHSTLEEGGFLYIVIQKKHGANSSLDKLKELFCDAKVLDKDGGYWIIGAQK